MPRTEDHTQTVPTPEPSPQPGGVQFCDGAPAVPCGAPATES